MAFDPDLYRGTAEAYDRHRLPYPPAFVDALVSRVRPTGAGRLLDLACGTGQLAFALRDAFAELWAVDREPDMVRVVAARGDRRVRAIRADAEELDAPPAAFELITVGNAFHRLRRDAVATRAHGWLRPGGHLALCWSSSPWTGDAAWQGALRAALDAWVDELGAAGRVPAGWDGERRARPDATVLAEAGFAPAGRYEVVVEHRWTADALAGYVSATSFLPAPLLGARAAEFSADLARRLAPHGPLVDRVGYAFDLFRTPPAYSQPMSSLSRSRP